jgi:hypothetical protein
VSDAQRIVLPDLSDDDNLALSHLLEVIRGKARFNALVDAYYDGEKNLSLAHGGMIPPRYYRLGLVLGWTAKAVDALGRRCTLESMVWPDGDLADLGMSELWTGNRLGSEVGQGTTSSLIHAVAFVTAARGETGEPSALVHFHDASDATGDWNPRTRRLDNLLVIGGRDKNGSVDALTLYLDGRTVTAKHDSSGWSTDVSEHTFGVPAAPLAYRPRLKRPFGRSRISRPVRAIQDAAARELVRLEGHMDLYSFPEFWMLGADPSIFKNADGSLKADWQVMLGRIKGIPDDEDATNPRADVKQFSAASPEPHLAALNAHAKLFAREASLPDSSVAITDVSNPTSAESYDASQYELIAEAEGATDEWSAPLRYVTQVALAMQNGLAAIPADWATIDTKWRDPRFLSRAAEADAGSKQVAAVPWLAETEVGLELLGLDTQQIERALGERKRAQATGRLDALIAEARQPAPQVVPESVPDGLDG